MSNLPIIKLEYTEDDIASILDQTVEFSDYEVPDDLYEKVTNHPLIHDLEGYIAAYVYNTLLAILTEILMGRLPKDDIE